MLCVATRKSHQANHTVPSAPLFIHHVHGSNNILRTTMITCNWGQKTWLAPRKTFKTIHMLNSKKNVNLLAHKRKTYHKLEECGLPNISQFLFLFLSLSHL